MGRYSDKIFVFAMCLMAGVIAFLIWALIVLGYRNWEQGKIAVPCDRACHPAKSDPREGTCWCLPEDAPAFEKELSHE